MRSLVPMLKNFTRLARLSAIIAADGVSIITPISTSSANATPSSRSCSRHSSSNTFAASSSSTPEIIGYMIFRLPKTLARRMARSCVRNRSFSWRHSRMARHPRNGFISSATFTCESSLSPPRSSVRMITGSGASDSVTLRYAANCSSSSGRSLRLMNKNSVRNRPTPIAPHWRTLSTSAARSMLAERMIRWPSRVSAASSWITSRLSSIEVCRSTSWPYSKSVCSDGSMTTKPLKPSSSTDSPVCNSLIASPSPSTAGMRSERARMAVCDVRLPTSVANPSTIAGSIIAVSDGVRSWATTTHGSVRSARPVQSAWPIRSASTRCATSRMSAARSLR